MRHWQLLLLALLAFSREGLMQGTANAATPATATLTTPETPPTKPATPEPPTTTPTTSETTTAKPATPEPPTITPTTSEMTTAKPATPEPPTTTPTTSETTTAKPATPEPPTTTSATSETTTAKSATPESPTTTSATSETATSQGKTTTSAVTTPKDPCKGHCPEDSLCELRFGDEPTCVCPGGKLYKDPKCVEVKVFAGDVTVGKPYMPEMEDKTSKVFQDTSAEIVNRLEEAFKKVEGLKDSYESTVVIRLRKASAAVARVWTERRTAPEVIAEIENNFKKESAVTQENVTTTIASTGVVFTAAEERLCERNPLPCGQLSLTKCTVSSGEVTCPCIEGFGDIDKGNCGVCPSGKKAEDGKCKGCKFGYTGYNCKDDYQLIATVVGSVIGVLLVVSMSVTTFAFLRKPKAMKKKKEKKSKGLLDDDIVGGLTYGNPVAQTKAPFPVIPRVDTNRAYGTAGAMEMTSSINNSYGRPNMDRGGNGMVSSAASYRSNTPNGGYRSNTPTSGQGFDRGGAHMSSHRAYMSNGSEVANSAGMGGYRAQNNQNRSNDWGRPQARDYEEPRNFGQSNIPRVSSQYSQQQDRPFNPYADRRPQY